MFSKEDGAKLQKIGCYDLFDLALYLPNDYEDNHPTQELILGSENLIECELKSFKREPKLYRINAYVPRFDRDLELIFFNYKQFQIDELKKKESHFLKGKLQASGLKLSLIQPKIVTQIDEVRCKYKTTALKNKTIRELVEKYITAENLISIGLPKDICEKLLSVHFPSREFCLLYKKQGGFFGEYLKAIKYLEIYSHLLRLSKKRKDFEAHYHLDGSVEPFIKSLPFKLTNDQLSAIDDIKQDLRSNIAAKRVIVGDVGCGKTMVILASAVMALPYKSILMCPTTVLANQIYDEAKKFLPKNLKVALVTQTSDKERLQDAYFIIGTHALLYRELPHSALVMIDEQHRFGTKQRQLLSQFFESDGKKPHFLQFSATPIPRTLAMIESSLVDISYIRELPYIKDIATKIVDKSHFKNMMEHIKSQIGQKYQTIIVYPLVEESESINYMSIAEGKGFWQKYFDGVYVTHGKDRDKEQVIDEFKERGNILLATTLIEVGISLPSLSTIVIVAPERLGLATLHQLRGRVGRYGFRGYCFLYTNSGENARLVEFAKTLNGFEIAELDLKYRNSGDLLSGKYQSGKNFVWIDLESDEEIIKEATKRLAAG